MINRRFNQLAHWDNAQGDRYSVELDIISVELNVDQANADFPFIEVLETTIIDHHQNKRYQGIVGNNFSSFVRDYDFSVLLPAFNQGKASFSVPENYGDLHGELFKHFLNSDVYQANFSKAPVICLSVSTNKVYQQTTNSHPILGVEYQQNENSLTDAYFGKMGLKVRYFMPQNSSAPFAFYHQGDLLNDYSALELIATISTMESFQKIYRPEIYAANTAASKLYQPSLNHDDHATTLVEYDRVERSQLAVVQGQYADVHFIQPYQAVLDNWLATQQTK